MTNYDEFPERLHNGEEAGLGTNPVANKAFITKVEKNSYLSTPSSGEASYSVLFCISTNGDLCLHLLFTKQYTYINHGRKEVFLTRCML